MNDESPPTLHPDPEGDKLLQMAAQFDETGQLPAEPEPPKEGEAPAEPEAPETLPEPPEIRTKEAKEGEPAEPEELKTPEEKPETKYSKAVKE